MNELQLFNFKGHDVTTITDGKGNPWFVAKEVCEILGFGHTPSAIRELDANERNTVRITHGNRGNPNVTIINEPGLYSLILRSRKLEARAFKKWVTSEVLPSIRRTGQYQLDVPLEEKLEMFMKGYQIEKQKRLELESVVEDMEPKAVAHDEAMDLGESMTMTTAAKMLGIGSRSIGPMLAHPRLHPGDPQDGWVPD